MAIAYVRTVNILGTGTITGNVYTSPTLTAISSGDSIVGYIQSATNITLLSVTDSAGNLYSIQNITLEWNGYNAYDTIFMGVNISGSPTTLSFTFSAAPTASDVYGGYLEFSGVSSINAVAVYSESDGLSPAATITTTAANCMLVSVLNTDGSAATQPSGYTLGYNNPASDGGFIAYDLVSGTGSHTGTWTVTGATHNIIGMVALSPQPAILFVRNSNVSNTLGGSVTGNVYTSGSFTAIQSNDSIVGWMQTSDNITLSSVTDADSNIYHVTTTAHWDGYVYNTVFYGTEIAGSPTALKFTFSGPPTLGNIYGRFLEFSGGPAVNASVGFVESDGASPAASLTTTIAGCMLVSLLCTDASGVITQPSAFTIGNPIPSGVMAYQLSGVAGSYTGTWAVSGATYNVIGMVALSEQPVTIDSLLPTEYLTRALIDPIVPAEMLAGQRGDGILPLEILGTQRRDAMLAAEFLATRFIDSEIPIEVQHLAIADPRMLSEIGFGVAANTIPPVEALSNAVSDRAMPTELAGAQTVNQIAPLEILKSHITDPRLPTEAGAGVTGNAPSPAEWTGILAADAIAAIEVAAHISQQSDALLPLEFVARAAADPMIAVEILATQAANASAVLETGGLRLVLDALLKVEYLTRALVDPTLPAETLSAALVDSGLPTETLLTGRADPTLAAEALATRGADPGLPVEIGAKQAADAVVALEISSLSTTANSDLPIEIGSTGMANISPPIEISAAVVADKPMPAEATAKRVADATVPSETVFGVASRSELPAEAAAGQAADTLWPAEWSGNATADTIGPIEIAKQVSARADSVLPIEIMGGAAANATASVEFLATRLSDVAPPLETIVRQVADARALTEYTSVATAVGADSLLPIEIMARSQSDQPTPIEIDQTTVQAPILVQPGRMLRPSRPGDVTIPMPFAPMEYGDSDRFAFDFTAVTDGAAIASVKWTCSLAPFQTGSDPQAAARVSQPQGATAIQMVDPLTSDINVREGVFATALVGGFPAAAVGATYVLEATVGTSDGRTLSLSSTVTIVAIT